MSRSVRKKEPEKQYKVLIYKPRNCPTLRKQTYEIMSLFISPFYHRCTSVLMDDFTALKTEAAFSV